MRISDASLLAKFEEIVKSHIFEGVDDELPHRIYGAVTDYLFVLYKHENINDYDVDTLINDNWIRCYVEVQHDWDGPFVGYEVSMELPQRTVKEDPLSAYERAMAIL